ncbi:MAG: MlaD family protein [Schleiferiaceae bacterium]|nr:MlaD family protein [Schleiferiaceae bacterium]
MRTEFKIGLAFILGFLLLYWGINFMKGEDIFSSQKKFYVVYDNTEGLLATRPVTINGYQVGQVNSIGFHPDQSGRLVVTLQVNNEFPITQGTVAKIYSASIMGEKSISLHTKKGTPLALSGDTLFSDTERDLTQEVNMQLAPIKARTEELLGTLDTVIGLASGFLDQRTSDNFKSTIESIEKTFQSVQESASEISNYLSDNKENFDAVSENFRLLSEELARNSADITSTIQNVEAISDSLSSARLTETINNMESITARFDRLMAELETGEGAASKIIYDEEVYANLKQATDNLNRLLLDIKYNPNKYLHVSVFGSRTRYTEEEIQAIERDIQSKQEE